MRRLLLIRHAKSSWKYPHLHDHERPLNKRGERDIPLMISRLVSREKTLDSVVSSTAVRAKTLAQALAKAFETSLVIKPELYTFSSSHFLNCLYQLPDTNHCIALVGHNPAITATAEWLTSKRIENIPTSGVLAIQSSAQHWSLLNPANCHLDYFDFPKKINRF